MVAIAKRLEIDQKNSLLQREHFKATHDPLTGLLNPIALNERIDQEIALGARYNKSFAVLMLELDQFRDAAFQHSKSISNPLLVEFTKRIKRSVRTTDTLARLESDVLLVLLPDIQDFRNVVKVIENINRHLLDPFLINDSQYVASARIGISLFPHDAHTRKDLIERAHVALFKNRDNAHCGYRFYDGDIDDRVAHTINFETKVRDAIDQRKYDIHYLPVRRLDGNELSFVEADTVWHDSELRDCTNKEVDDCIESLELSKLFGDIQLTSICQQMSGWRGDMEFHKTPVLVDLTSAQFQDPQLPKRYETIIHHQSVKPQRIGFIVREADILPDTTFAARQITALKQLGCLIVIDEFSCGLSYVGQLNLATVDMIRLKGELIEKMDEQIEWLCIVEGVVRIGRQLDISTIIGHVNNDYQYQTLLNVNGDYWQGDYACIVTDESGLDHHQLTLAGERAGD